jgi:putative membrane-bound dehydrogenase-like protein
VELLPVNVQNFGKFTLCFAWVLFGFLLGSCSRHDDRLHVFIRVGDKPGKAGEHDYARFLNDWKKLLTERGAVVEGGTEFPGKKNLARIDVVVLYTGAEATMSTADKSNLDAFTKRGGGLVLVHDALRGVDPGWSKANVGAGWDRLNTKTRAGSTGLSFQDAHHAITEGVSGFELDDEFAYDLQMAPDLSVIATSAAPSQKEPAPQIWAYEKSGHRSVVFLPGHNYGTFTLPHVRGLLLRSVAWAGKKNVDSLTSKLELAHLQYPGGGPTPAEEAMKKIKVHRDFDLSLVAAEPLVTKPMYIDWDAKGRMWVAVTPDYPFNTQTNAAGKGAIIVLEDTNGDGRMDNKRVFADGINFLTSFVFYRDGVIVSEAPEIVWLRDTDGDGIADKREVLFGGFSRVGSRSVINSLRWGLDGWIYGDQGETASSSESIVNAKGTAFGKIGNGIFRFRPDGSRIEMVSAFNGNSWGFDFSWDGELFFSKSSGPHILHLMMPEKFLQRARIGKVTSDKTIEDHQKIFPLLGNEGQFTQVSQVAVFAAASGSMLYQGGAWPMRYQNSHFVCDPTVHIVHEDVISPIVEGGIGYEATRAQKDEFLASSDSWFRPICSRYGPDGAMYLLDLYDHEFPAGERSYAAVRGDHEELHGRVWRVQHRHAHKLDVPVLADAPATNLVKALEHPNEWIRSTARRLLVERSETNATRSLSSLVSSNRVPYVRINALWALHQLRTLRESNLVHAVEDIHPAVQKNALRIVTERGMPLSTNVERVVLKESKSADDRVKLNGLFALQQGGLSKETRQSILRHFPEQKDLWAKSAYQGIAMTAPMDFIKEALAIDKGEGLTNLVGSLADHLVQTGSLSNAVALILRLGNGKKAGLSILQAAIMDSFTRAEDPEFMPPWTSELESAFKTLLSSESSTVRYNSLALANQWDKGHVLDEETAKAKEQLLDDLQTAKKDEQQIRLISTVMSIPSIHADVIPMLDKLFDGKSSAAVLHHIVKEFGRSSEKAIAPVLLRHFSSLNFEGKQLAMGVLFKRPEWVATMIDEIENKEVRLSDLGAQAVSRLQAYPDGSLAKRAVTVIESIQGPIQKQKEVLIAKFRPVLDQKADLKNGSEMFKNHCALCHKLGEKDKEKDKEIGPDLLGVGVHGPLALLTDILDPNHLVETNYLAFQLRTRKQGDYYGIVISENKETIKLRNLDGDSELKLADVVFKRSSGLSLMPEGLEALGQKNIRDIVAYLIDKSAKGYRTLDLAAGFTADSRKGLFSDDAEKPSLEFKKFGLLTIDHVPFEIASPTALADGKNLIVLKGGAGVGKTVPQRVEIPVGSRATTIHVLGGVAGGGYQGGNTAGTNETLVRASVLYRDGKSEEHLFRNGYEFADYARRIDVPGSRYVPDLVAEGQIRVFSFKTKRTNEISKIVLESMNGPSTPTFVALTAQLSDR